MLQTCTLVVRCARFECRPYGALTLTCRLIPTAHAVGWQLASLRDFLEWVAVDTGAGRAAGLGLRAAIVSHNVGVTAVGVRSEVVAC